jgi:hypothetical protein
MKTRSVFDEHLWQEQLDRSAAEHAMRIREHRRKADKRWLAFKIGVVVLIVAFFVILFF